MGGETPPPRRKRKQSEASELQERCVAYMRVVGELAAARTCSGLAIPLMPGLTGYAVIEKLRLTLVQVDAREGRCHLQHEPG